MPYEFKAPLGVKILLGCVALSLIGYNIFYVAYKANRNKKEFYKSPFSSKVVSSNWFEERTIEFHLENGLKLYFLPPVDEKIVIGDSVEKKEETYEYRVFRKDKTNEYKYYSTYNFENIQ